MNRRETVPQGRGTEAGKPAEESKALMQEVMESQNLKMKILLSVFKQLSRFLLSD